MNYRHVFHAGNFADVMKHAVLSLLIEHLCRKPAAFRVLDTHAGIGLYDLDDPSAQRTGEFRDGIGRLYDRPAPDPVLSVYLDAVRRVNAGEPDGDGRLRRYPGSPALVRALMRPTDRLVAVERHPDDAAALRRTFAGDPTVAVHRGDGYAALKAHLPPVERRGLVLIDPPFEEAGEFERLTDGLRAAYRRWPTGIYALWYPIKERPAIWRFHEALAASGIRRILVAELTIHPEDTHLRLNGSGMVIVNPPWRLDETLRAALPALHGALTVGGGGSTVTWLVGEDGDYA